MKFIKFSTKVSKFPNFHFRRHFGRRTFTTTFDVQILDPLRKFTSIRNTIGSGLTRVATGNVSKIYQTNLFAQLIEILLENVSFDLNYPIFNIRKPQSKITRYGVHLPNEDFPSYVVG